jgi:hypothetical protein
VSTLLAVLDSLVRLLGYLVLLDVFVLAVVAAWTAGGNQ